MRSALEIVDSLCATIRHVVEVSDRILSIASLTLISEPASNALVLNIRASFQQDQLTRGHLRFI